MIQQTVLSFKVEKTNDIITAHGDLALFGEFVVGIGISAAINQHLPKPGCNEVNNSAIEGYFDLGFSQHSFL